MMESTASTMTVEHLGEGATDQDLVDFRDAVRLLMERDDLPEQEATDVVWNQGDWGAVAYPLLARR